MFPSLRLLTVHPALVHVPVGAAPLIFLAYAISLWRRSPEWTFVGDGLLFLLVPFTLLAFAFGLISNAIAPWPGGLRFWRTAHLLLGIATTALVVGLAAYRWRRRRRKTPAAQPVFLLGIGLLVAVVGATGWVGGEVLVFHSGIGVRAAADGALAPTLGTWKPKGLGDVMGQLRGAWGDAQVTLAGMIAQHPAPEGFARIRADASQIEQLSTWLGKHPPKRLSDADTDALGFMADSLRRRAVALGESATRSSLPRVSRDIAAISATCAGCHAQLRWKSFRTIGVER